MATSPKNGNFTEMSNIYLISFQLLTVKIAKKLEISLTWGMICLTSNLKIFSKYDFCLFGSKQIQFSCEIEPANINHIYSLTMVDCFKSPVAHSKFWQCTWPKSYCKLAWANFRQIISLGIFATVEIFDGTVATVIYNYSNMWFSW